MKYLLIVAFCPPISPSFAHPFCSDGFAGPLSKSSPAPSCSHGEQAQHIKMQTAREFMLGVPLVAGDNP